jgi:ElaB/YqjD/DUF883 family membrane-anchored ribosome-binding protein
MANLQEEKPMATTNTTTRGEGRHRGADVAAKVENAYDGLQQAAGNLKQSARATGKELQHAAERELEMASDSARQMGRRTSLMIRRHPWTAVGAALLVGAIAGRFL